MEAKAPERERLRPRALQEAATMCEAFRITAADHPERAALCTKDDSFSITWGDYAERVERLAGGLSALGLGRADTIGIMLTNRPEFYLADSAAIHLGATPYSIYNTYAAGEIEYLVEDAGSRVLVTEQAFLDTILKVREASGAVDHVIVVDGQGEEDTLSLADVEQGAPEGFALEEIWREVEPDDILTLIYTSGTTGPPKGVQLTHGNLVAAIRSFDEVIAFPDDGRVISWLPLAHIAERACSHYLPMMLGFTTTCCPDPREIIAYLPEVHPTWFFAVPRIWEKLKAGLETKLAAEEDEQRRQAAQRALQVGLEKVRAEQAGEQVPEELLAEYERMDELVLSKLREQLGLDQVESVNVGAAPCPPEVIEFFHAIGIPLAELWGMSETCGAGTCNPPERVKIGTVGPAPPGIEIKLADDGEILVRGPIVMAGYRNQPEKTAETIDEDGWLTTGDIGELDEDGYLRIVDRKKELIINAAGKNMSPANIESKLKTIPLVDQAIAIGDRRKYVTALLTLDPEAASAWARQQGIEEADLASLAGSEKVVEEVERGVEAANEELARVEQVKRFKILPAPWEPGGDELTPTMKLKRKPIAEKYEQEIEALYAD
jgi:long-chain acyl-CoA synthetase